MAVTKRSLSLLHKLRTEVGQLADDAAAAIGGAWADTWDQLTPAWQSATTAAADAATRAGRWPSSWQLARIPQVASASLRTEQATGPLVVASARFTANAATAAAAAALAAEPEILAAQTRGVAAATFSRGIMAARVDTLHEQTRDRVRDSTATLAFDTIRAAQQTLILGGGQPDAGVMLGRIHTAFDGGRVRALNTARTETLDWCRSASGYVHDVNAEAIAGWLWSCALGLRSCPACWAMHGTMHPLRQPGPWGHQNCRCVRAALVRVTRDDGTTDLASGLPDAQARFKALSRADQIRIMGASRLQLLDDGDITWSDLPVLRTNKGWRQSWAPRPVANLRRMAGRRT